MEEEERSAQSAKLQELIRRGTPHDLQEANRLMKVMAGYDTRHKTDYRAKAAEEVSKIQQKAKILEEMLANYNPQDRATDESAEVSPLCGTSDTARAANSYRNSPTHWPAHTPRSRRCARRNPKTTRQSPSCSRSTTASTARRSATSS